MFWKSFLIGPSTYCCRTVPYRTYRTYRTVPECSLWNALWLHRSPSRVFFPDSRGFLAIQHSKEAPTASQGCLPRGDFILGRTWLVCYVQLLWFDSLVCIFSWVLPIVTPWSVLAETIQRLYRNGGHHARPSNLCTFEQIGRVSCWQQVWFGKTLVSPCAQLHPSPRSIPCLRRFETANNLWQITQICPSDWPPFQLSSSNLYQLRLE
ncbi:uncharacterized protein YALI1_E11807g [Yarrowia lipolytica]|uniref:Uncharacterized protein n=1 Tax=Yarrowia lipolytica TaxID=4952 RepID=A0A1D8NHS2_YARLL|nr:hypothetical protein YALI1_E11807g [Yarrowia lipolytica]